MRRVISTRMIDAGIRELSSYERGSDEADDVVVAIYEAMEAARFQEQIEERPRGAAVR
jgi:hypothetical protein